MCATRDLPLSIEMHERERKRKREKRKKVREEERNKERKGAESERLDWKNARNFPAFTQVPCHADY